MLQMSCKKIKTNSQRIASSQKFYKDDLATPKWFHHAVNALISATLIIVKRKLVVR